MAESRPTCAACGQAIEPGAGRYRRDDREFHAGCYGRPAPGPLAEVPVLLVADEDLLERLAAFLRAAGAHVIPATGPSEAVALLTAVLPRVVVTAMTFPGQRHDGYWLLRELRRRGSSTPVPVIGVVNDKPAIDPAEALAFDAVLAKPDGEQLVAVVRGVLESAR